MTKPIERGIARCLRAQHGTPVKELARLLGVSPASVSLWVRDIEISREHRLRNVARARRDAADAWRELNRRRRLEWQEEGRQRAHKRDPLHVAGCMLYWAEGGKARNVLTFANSDVHMLRVFGRFLREVLGVPAADFRIRLNVYLNNGVRLRQIEDHWLEALEAPRESLRGHTLNHYPTSSSGNKRSLPYGVCALRVVRSTRLVQHIYGAIQEYGGFDEPGWLDGPPRAPRAGTRQPVAST